MAFAPELDDEDEAAAVAAAERLPALVEQWEKLVVEGTVGLTGRKTSDSRTTLALS